MRKWIPFFRDANSPAATFLKCPEGPAQNKVWYIEHVAVHFDFTAGPQDYTPLVLAMVPVGQSPDSFPDFGPLHVTSLPLSSAAAEDPLCDNWTFKGLIWRPIHEVAILAPAGLTFTGAVRASIHILEEDG